MSASTSLRADIPLSTSPPPLSDGEFRQFREFILERAGIYLGEHKRALLVGRLSRRLRELGLTSFSSYYDRVMASGAEETTQLLNCICTHETHFFREPEHFSFIVEAALPALRVSAEAGRAEKSVRAWSAACSTGEEPYSIAMTLRRHLPRDAGWNIEVVASDLSTRALAQAQRATWPVEKARDIPQTYLREFMLRGTGPQIGKMKAGAELRALVSFVQANLNDDVLAVPGTFDLLFCRNVLIYFDAAGKRRVIERLLAKLAPGGLLFLGHAETLAGFADNVQSVAANVYRIRTAESSGALMSRGA